MNWPCPELGAFEEGESTKTAGKWWGSGVKEKFLQRVSSSYFGYMYESSYMNLTSFCVIDRTYRNLKYFL